MGILLAALALSATGMASEGGTAAWETLRSEDGIVASRRDVPGSRFVAFRGEGDVDAPLLRVASVLVDIGRGHEWIDSVAEGRILRRVSETEYVTYTHIKTPPTMSDRDFVLDMKLEVDPGAKSITVKGRSVDDPAAPQTHYVRAEMDESVFRLTPTADGRRTHVVAEIHCDPKGSVAGWVVNWFQKNWGYSTLRNLRRQVPRADVKENQELAALLAAKGVLP
jgi:hypothetical protein